MFLAANRCSYLTNITPEKIKFGQRVVRRTGGENRRVEESNLGVGASWRRLFLRYEPELMLMLTGPKLRKQDEVRSIREVIGPKRTARSHPTNEERGRGFRPVRLS